MSRNDIKLIARYIIIAYFIYLSHFIIQPDYINSIKGIGEIAIGAIYGSVFGVLGWVVKSNWSTAPDKGVS
jgi:hypothetical protein